MRVSGGMLEFSRNTADIGIPFRSSRFACDSRCVGSDSGSDEQRRAANMLGFRPKRVTPDMVRRLCTQCAAGIQTRVLIVLRFVD